jgi:hypothetical protein
MSAVAKIKLGIPFEFALLSVSDFFLNYLLTALEYGAGIAQSV